MAITRYPIVLVHGMAVKDVSFYRAFRGILDFLQAQGVKVYVSNQDGIGTIRTNAEQLKEEILAVLEQENCEKVNLIAHSKGGLDSRYMICKLGMHNHVASLTTLSTPHHGSRLSRTLLKMPTFVVKTLNFFVNGFYKACGDKQPDLLASAEELTDVSMEAFNRAVPDHPAVYYQSYSSQAEGKNAFLVYLPYQISKYCEQDETDGMVSVASSQWGDYKGQMQGNLNHLQMVGVYGSKKRLQDVGAFYWKIVQELKEKGF